MYAAGGAGVTFLAYYYSCRQEVPYTHRKHAILLVTEDMERHLGEETFKSVSALNWAYRT